MRVGGLPESPSHRHSKDGVVQWSEDNWCGEEALSTYFRFPSFNHPEGGLLHLQGMGSTVMLRTDKSVGKISGYTLSGRFGKRSPPLADKVWDGMGGPWYAGEEGSSVITIGVRFLMMCSWL